MKVELTREWLPITWIAVPVAVPLLLGSAVVHLNGLRGRVHALQEEVATKRNVLASIAVPGEEAAALDVHRSKLAEWTEMTTSDSLRVAELARIAESAGVTLRSLRSVEQDDAEAGELISSSHDVTAVGDYRALATFLDGVYGARGMARVDELKLHSDESPGATTLLAALRVTWSARAAAAPAAEQGVVR